jgi:cadmium resistance protein CadD (predicted permease)
MTWRPRAHSVAVMRKAVQTTGFLLAIMGISGAIDHLATQPIMGAVLNAFNRYLIPHVDALTGYELFANLTIAAIGGIAMVAGDRIPQ